MQRFPVTVAALVALVALEALADEPVRLYYHETVGILEAARIRAVELGLRLRSTPHDTVPFSYGSTATGHGSHPYSVGVMVELASGAASVCSAAMVSNTRAVTAAHCWWDGHSQARRFLMVFGSTMLYWGGVRVETSDVVVHEDYDPPTTLGNDIAVVKFTRVDYSDAIKSIPLATGSASYAGVLAEAIGFGRTENSSSGSHRVVVLEVITNAVCRRTYGSRIVESTLCTSGGSSVGVCDGDSGGPLVADGVLIGAASFAAQSGCGGGKPSGFTRITSFASWIQARM